MAIAWIILILSVIIAISWARSNSYKRKKQNRPTNTYKKPESSNQNTNKPVNNPASENKQIHEPVKTAYSAPPVVKKPAEPKIVYADAVDYLKRARNVDYLVHYTPIDNLSLILKDGILPRTMQTVKGSYVDETRLDGNPDCSSFSISFPNYQMLYMKMREGKYSYVILKIDVEALRSIESSNMAFFPCNAANSKCKGQFDKYTGQDALENMFYSPEFRKNLNIPASYTTDPQAEILIRGRIAPEYIKYVYVDNNDSFERAKKICSSSRSVVVSNDRSLYASRSDWKFWKKGYYQF